MSEENIQKIEKLHAQLKAASDSNVNNDKPIKHTPLSTLKHQFENHRAKLKQKADEESADLGVEVKQTIPLCDISSQTTSRIKNTL